MSAITYNSRGKDLSRNDITRYGVTERPPEGIQVDECNTDNTASGGPAHITVGHGWGPKADVEGEIEHGCALDRCSD